MLAADKIAIYNVYNGGLLLLEVYGRRELKQRKTMAVHRRGRRKMKIGKYDAGVSSVFFVF